jgi:DNA adenine methylase
MNVHPVNGARTEAKELYPAARYPPLLKWPGGKRALLKYILPLIPHTFQHYFEPFLGGGALFFALGSSNAVLADKNDDLIDCYQQVRDNPEAVIAVLSRLKNTEDDYYAVRDSTPTDDAAKAARLIYLATLSFNGIHRVNLQGQFNVPYGHKKHLQPCDPARIRAASRVLSSARLLCDDFESAVTNAAAGDLVYLDPPYTVAHGNNGFVKYNARIFSWNDQVRLASVARKLARRGCHVIVSNADHPSIQELYPNFQRKKIIRQSVIAASKKKRRAVTECIFFHVDELRHAI